MLLTLVAVATAETFLTDALARLIAAAMIAGGRVSTQGRTRWTKVAVVTIAVSITVASTMRAARRVCVTLYAAIRSVVRRVAFTQATLTSTVTMPAARRLGIAVPITLRAIV